jgi:hypothetical protein
MTLAKDVGVETGGKYSSRILEKNKFILDKFFQVIISVSY